MNRAFAILALILATPALGQDNAKTGEELNAVIRTVLEQSSTEDVPFRDVIRAVTGRQVLRVDREKSADAAVISAVTAAIRESITEMNVETSPARQESRINEVSRHFEAALQRKIDELADFSCAVPKTASGKAQSSGYPDLRIVHAPSGRVAYLDPKLLNRESVTSSLRTFYYTPRTTTSKVLDDAHHLLIGIEHDGKVGQWQFTGWKLVDLYDFRVRLKAEYQASNRDLYREGLILEND